MPRLLREVVEHAVRAQPDLDLVRGETDGAQPVGCDELRDAVTAAGAQVAIVGLSSDAMTAMYDDVLFEIPRLRLLAVTGDGRGAIAYELRPHVTPLGDASADTLLRAIRGVRAGGARSSGTP
jgi:hypothetical protein